jgi:hypothetical protein
MLMKKKMFSIICWVLICQILLIACSEDSSPIKFEKGYVNQQLLLSVPGRFNTFNTKDPIYLEIRSKSDYEIVLPNDLNLRIFERNAGDWIEIKELPMTRLPTRDVILAPNKKFIQTTTTFPSLPDPTRRYQLRIYVSGDMKTEEGIRQVVAYTDTQLFP